MAELMTARIAAIVFACALLASARAQDAPPWKDIAYTSGGLRIQAYLYKPDGEGPFPAVIYNHGSREGYERASRPFEYIGRMLAGAGYVVLVPERRGYGSSDGATWSEEVGRDQGKRFVERLERETDDVIAARDYLRGLPFVDAKRIGVMGWSLGGIVTMFAAARGDGFAAAVNQAGGALSWNANRSLQLALRAAAEKSSTPTLLLVADNDRTTASITTLTNILERRGVPHRQVIYEPFHPSRETRAAPGHAIFSSEGVSRWQGDVREFLARHLMAP